MRDFVGAALRGRPSGEIKICVVNHGRPRSAAPTGVYDRVSHRTQLRLRPPAWTNDDAKLRRMFRRRPPLMVWLPIALSFAVSVKLPAQPSQTQIPIELREADPLSYAV